MVHLEKLLPIAYTELLLGAFAKLRKANIRFVMSIRPSALNNSASAGPLVSKLDIWVFFENLLRKLKLN